MKDDEERRLRQHRHDGEGGGRRRQGRRARRQRGRAQRTRRSEGERARAKPDPHIRARSRHRPNDRRRSPQEPSHRARRPGGLRSRSRRDRTEGPPLAETEPDFGISIEGKLLPKANAPTVFELLRPISILMMSCKAANYVAHSRGPRRRHPRRWQSRCGDAKLQAWIPVCRIGPCLGTGGRIRPSGISLCILLRSNSQGHT